MCTALAVNCSVGDDDNGWFGFRCSYCCSWTHGNELGTDKPIKRPAEVERPNTQLSTKKPNNNHLDLLFLFWLESSAHFTKFHKSNSAYIDVHCVWLGEQTEIEGGLCIQYKRQTMVWLHCWLDPTWSLIGGLLVRRCVLCRWQAFASISQVYQQLIETNIFTKRSRCWLHLHYYRYRPLLNFTI